MAAPVIDRPRLFLLTPGFEDAAFPGQRFFCRHSALVEGVLASFPVLNDSLEVCRIGFARPRDDVIALLGEGHQAVPVLILPRGATADGITGTFDGLSFAAGTDPIIAVLTERYALPSVHP